MSNNHVSFDAPAFEETYPTREEAAHVYYRAPAGSEEESKALERYRVTVQQAIAAALIAA